MSTIIYTGDEAKCRVTHLMECPACFRTFEVTEGTFVYSDTVGDTIRVCSAHKSVFTGDEEANIQSSVEKCVKHDRGHIQKNGTLIKKSVLLERVPNKFMKNLMEG